MLRFHSLLTAQSVLNHSDDKALGSIYVYGKFSSLHLRLTKDVPGRESGREHPDSKDINQKSDNLHSSRTESWLI